ncbi:hypothetical protein L1887_16676 [Cichorium endivia]|nr:hypothetical protein L1887_16676 [Cichorium endivia]
MENVAQVAGVDAFRLTNLIVSAARNSTAHRYNCKKLAGHVKLIGNLLEKLNSTEVMKHPATREPLEGLWQALAKALELVESCKEKSYLYMLAMGWSVVYQFRYVQNEIDRYLKLVPLISLVHDFRNQNLKESFQAIEDDHQEYTLEQEDIEAQIIIMKHSHSQKDALVLEKSLSCHYPSLKFQDALQEEKEKLQIELQNSQYNNDSEKSQVIGHLLDVTQNVVNSLPQKDHSFISETHIATCDVSTTNSHNGKNDESEWHADLFGCYKEPCLCLKACICPCAILTEIANLVSNGKLSRGHACRNLMTYSLFCGCFFYTCCVRRQIRQHFNIKGGSCDDFVTHMICCSCAMVQEWRELELRDFKGCQDSKMVPPSYQFMKP